MLHRNSVNVAFMTLALGALSLASCSEATDNQMNSEADSGTGGNSSPLGGMAAGTGIGGAGGTKNDAGHATAGSAGTAADARPALDAGASGKPDAAPVAAYPASLLPLGSWKLTLPIAGNSASSPLEIEQPALATYSLVPYFHLNDSADGVLFRANAGGVTTSGSGYPRSELREMSADGKERASWSTSVGVHTMILEQAILHTPEKKPHVVAAQIHDSADDVVMIRLEGKNLFVEGGGNSLGVLDPAYVLGTRYTVKILASQGKISIYYNDLTTPKVIVNRSSTGCYFKAGAYTQSNTAKGDLATAYGEVVIFKLSVQHQ